MTRPFSDVQGIQVIDPQQLTRSERLERWATALEKLGEAPLRTLRETEHRCNHERQLMREDNSPLTIAFEEPVLRSAGLQDDTFGAACRFFGLSDWDLHNILCDCHFGSTVRASEVAARLRSLEALAASRMYAVSHYGAIIAAGACGVGLLLAFSA